MDRRATKFEDFLLKKQSTPGHGENTTWRNETGLALTFKVVENGLCSGIVKTIDGDVKEYPFVGRYDTTGMGVIGWTVNWENKQQNDHMVTTWSGQFQWDESIMDMVIFTTWLLTRQTKPNDDWNSTTVGKDTFWWNPFAKERIREAKLHCQCSHPTQAKK